jgi:hypothetical protein
MLVENRDKTSFEVGHHDRRDPLRSPPRVLPEHQTTCDRSACPDKRIKKKKFDLIPYIRINNITILARTLTIILLIFLSTHETHKRMLIFDGIYL